MIIQLNLLWSHIYFYLFDDNLIELIFFLCDKLLKLLPADCFAEI